VTIPSPRPSRAVQRARLWAITWTASQAPLAANRPDGRWLRPTPYFQVADRVLDLGVTAVIGLEDQGLAVAVGDEGVVVVQDQERELAARGRLDPRMMNSDLIRPLLYDHEVTEGHVQDAVGRVATSSLRAPSRSDATSAQSGRTAETAARETPQADDVEHIAASTELRLQILESLTAQGFRWEGTRLIPPHLQDKGAARELHAPAVCVARDAARAHLRRHEDRLLGYIASGSEVDPQSMRPKLVEVHRRSEEELLFRYARLHWSIPTSRGYGRRLRFVVMDESNGKLIGLIGLADPVFALKDRDAWIGWSREVRVLRMRSVMDAYILGAVPPYSSLLAGKLVALLAASTEVREAFTGKYAGRTSYISGRTTDAGLALLTTTSALGRSSIYNRLSYGTSQVYRRIGLTRGTGEVHFANGLYAAMREHALRWCKPTARHPNWGDGFRNRREVIKKCLADVGLSPGWVLHGLQREVYGVLTAANSLEFLRGEADALEYLDRPAADLWSWFRQRWLLKRAANDPSFKKYDREAFRLWQASAVRGEGERAWQE